jgi:hypothetical protein
MNQLYPSLLPNLPSPVVAAFGAFHCDEKTLDPYFSSDKDDWERLSGIRALPFMVNRPRQWFFWPKDEWILSLLESYENPRLAY